MAFWSSLTNEEIKHRILDVFAKFVSDVEPAPLSDWLIQEKVITTDQWLRFRHENPTARDQCRALLNHLFSIQNPKAFLAVRQALSEVNHYLLESIHKKEPGCEVREQPDNQNVLQDENKIQQLDKNYEDQKKAWEAEKERLLQLIKVLETKLQLEEGDSKSKKITKEILIEEHIKDIDLLRKEFEANNNKLVQEVTTHEMTIKALKDNAEKLDLLRKESEASNNKLVEEVTTHEMTIKALVDNEQKLKLEMETMKTENESKISSLEEKLRQEQNEKEQLRKQIKEVQTIRDKRRSEYKSNPVLVQTITIEAAEEGKKQIRGMTILDKELFVVSEESSEVEVYDSMEFSFSRRWKLKELFDPWDIGSCNKNKCLYIFDYKVIHDQLKEILRVDPNGNLIQKWSTGNYFGFGLSVTDELNVILTVTDKNKLNEYSADGQLIREINLSSDTGIRYPRHAIKLTNGHFMVSHGTVDDLQRVCIVDADGKLKKSFGGKPGSTIGQLDVPIYLAVDGNGFVMVADLKNSRVLLLNSDLAFKREILTKEKHGLQNPLRILLDQTNGRLFVACKEWDLGRILIFGFK